MDSISTGQGKALRQEGHIDHRAEAGDPRTEWHQHETYNIIKRVWSPQGHHLQRTEGGVTMDIKEQMKDVPLTLTAIQEFRKFLDIREQFKVSEN